MAASHFLTGTHHCAILDGKEHGATHRQFNECTLHPGHEKFMTVDEYLNTKRSEIDLDDEEEMSKARKRIARAVRVVVYHTSVDRPDTFINSENPYPCKDIKGSMFIRYGTGCLAERCNVDGDDDDDDDDNDNGNYDNDNDNGNDDDDNDNHDVDNDIDNVPIYHVKEPCPCPGCKTSAGHTPNRKSYYFIIQTATHVIFDEQEAQRAVFEFFYDTEDRNNVEKLFGVTVLDTRHFRLQTDCCRVVCVTHDDSLAEKLGCLCEGGDYFLVDNVLVSHPHGVSKRISVGDSPGRTLVVIPNKRSVHLRKGMGIRFLGCHNATHIIEAINRLLNKRVIGRKRFSKTFVLRYNLTVFRPEGVVVETDWDHYLNDKLIKKNKVWCNVFYPGTQLVTDDGKRYIFPYNDDKVPRVNMEVFVKTKYFFDRNDKNNHSVFLYRRYNMASCPGSSGACVGVFGYHRAYTLIGHVHFGNSGHFNTSSLYCIHTPDDNEQEYKTKLMNYGNREEHNNGIRQLAYNQIQ